MLKIKMVVKTVSALVGMCLLLGVIGSPAAAAGKNAVGGGFEVPLAPTDAPVIVSGRVVVSQNVGVTGALVTLTDSYGISKTIRTGKSGIFCFTGVQSGRFYIISVSAKRYRFAPQAMDVMEDVTNLIFTAQ